MKRSLFVVFVAGLSFTFSPSARGDDAAPKPGEKSKAKSNAKSARKAAPAGAKAASDGEVTLKGQLTCAKCGLHESSVCQNVLLVPEQSGKADQKTEKYYLTKNDVAEAHHEEVCGNQVSATVTGRVADESGKKVLTASSITVN